MKLLYVNWEKKLLIILSLLQLLLAKGCCFMHKCMAHECNKDTVGVDIGENVKVALCPQCYCRLSKAYSRDFIESLAFNYRLFDCLECGKSFFQKDVVFVPDNNGISSFICRECAEKKKPKWSFGFLVALIIILILLFFLMVKQ